MRKLKLLMALLALLAGGGNASAYQTPVADGIYYLYNTGVTDGGSGFISRGENYAARGVIDKYGIPFKLVSTGAADTYYFQLYDTDLWLSDDGYMYTDGGTDRRRAIKVESQGEGIYKLINTNNSKEVENWYGHPVGDGEGNRRDYLWQFYSIAEYEAVVAGYTSTEKSTIATTMGWDLSGTNFDSYLSTNYVGIDKTSLIEHATFDTGHSTSGWTITPNANSSMSIGWGVEGGDQITPEVYQEYGTISQTVTVPSAGLYKVSVNAFVRNRNYEIFHSAGAVSSISYLKANDNKVRLCDIYSNGEVTSNFPDGPNAANNNFFSQGKYLNEVYVYVTDASKQITITLGNPSATAGCWMVFNNFKLTYYSDEVSDDDATAILATATAVLDKAMLKATKDALSDAKNTFDGSRTIAHFNALNIAIDNANASSAVYAPLGTKLTEAASVKSSVSDYSPSYVTTFDTYIGTITSNYNAGNYAESAISSIVAEIETEILKLVKSQTVSGSDMTRALPNAACTGAVGDDNWKIKNALASGEFFRLDTWAGTASGMSVPMIEYWITNGNTLSSNEIYQTISGLQEGVYTVTATTAVNNESNVAPTAGSALLFANDKTTDITTGGTETSFKGQTGTFSVNVVLTDADKGNLKLGLKTVSPNYNWIAFKNVTLTYYGDVATSDDYNALNAAISAKDGNTLGFETGEYAPYNNVAVLTALKNAKAINQDADNAHSIVVAATEALGAANWSAANASNVACVYNGDFSQGDWGLGGWTRTNNWGKNLPSDVQDLTAEILRAAGASTGSAYFNQPGSLQYGNAGVYTMPLKANTIYNLTFKYASWETDSNNGMTVSVLNNEDGMAAMVFPENNTLYSESGAFVTKTLVFVTGAAGDYVLTLANNGNTVMTDVSITKAANQYLNFADGSVPSYAPGTYPSVKITRTLTANRWATAVYPFAVSGVDNIAVLNSFDAGTGSIRFATASQSVANQPFLMRSASDKSEISLSNIDVSATTETPTVTKNEASLIGAYSRTEITDAKENYVLSNNTIYAVGDAGANINPYRAYIQIEGGGGASRSLVFLVDDEETTAIEGLNSERTTTVGNIYNLNGQLVRKNADNMNGLRKGIYIVGGKRITVK